MAETQQNFYRLKAACGGCGYDVRINDVPLFDDSIGGRVETEIPVNQWIRPGRNVLTRRVFPLAGEPFVAPAAECDLRLLVRERQQEWENRREVQAFPPLAAGGPEVVQQFDIEADVAFPEPLWFRSEQIHPQDTTVLDSLIPRLRILHALLSNQQWDLLLTMMRFKNEEIAASQYQSVADRERTALAELQALRRRIPGPLVPFHPEGARLQSHGYGRLAAVVDAEGEPLVRVEDEYSVASLRTLFCLWKGDLIWIR